MAKKNSIPKRVAGVKIPKVLRKSKTLHGLLSSEIGRQIVANALTAGAGAAAAALIREREQIVDAATGKAHRGAHVLGAISDAVQDGTAAVMGVVREAARSAMPDHGRKKSGGTKSAEQDSLDDVRH